MCSSHPECGHTKLITTMDIARIPGATHIPLREENARETALRILREGIEAYRRRDPAQVSIPPVKNKAVVGFSTETILSALSAVDPQDPLKPLIDNIVAGNTTPGAAHGPFSAGQL
ncbi:MAG: hypothetical protein HY900_18485 [Deltaproteobacteria bacterium]|nr:hypothetical protein [Deltaproteobacteria bacterium]